MTSRKRKHLQTLGLCDGANEADIRKAFYKMARMYHPDKNSEPGAEERFKKISNAYEVLSGKCNDNTASESCDDGGGGGSRHGSSRTYHFYQGFSAQFDDFFAGAGGFGFNFSGFRQANGAKRQRRQEPPKPAKPATKVHELYCTLEELATGTTRKIEITAELFDSSGGGARNEKRKLDVVVKAGYLPGTRLVYKNIGSQSGVDGERGDVAIVIQASPHKLFELHNYDLVYPVLVKSSTLLPGWNLDVTTVYGERIRKRIRGPIGDGSTHRIANCGLPSTKTPARGYLIVKFIIKSRL